MSPEEYKATRERLGMTQAALAVALDVSRKAINQREQGGTITREAAMALEFLALRSPKRSRKSENGMDEGLRSSASDNTTNSL